MPTTFRNAQGILRHRSPSQPSLEPDSTAPTCRHCGGPIGSRGNQYTRGFCTEACDDTHTYTWYSDRLKQDPLYFLRGPEPQAA